jgi:hypothetical protein
VVKEVEELGSKTKAHLFGQLKLALQPKIRLRGSETAKHIALEIALLPCGWCGKSYLVENIAARILGGVESGECVQEGTLRCF